MKHVIALDVSKGKSTIVIYNGDKQCEFEGELYHTRTDFKQLHERIEQLTMLDGQAPDIVFEATGVYSKPLEKLFADYGHVYCRINPLEARLQMASMRRHKTDLSDAHELAKSHFKSDRENTYIQDEYYEQMRAMTRYYDEIDEEIILVRSRMHAILQLSFPELEKLLSPSSALFFNFVQLYPHPALLLAHSKTVIKHRLKSNTRKNLYWDKSEINYLPIEPEDAKLFLQLIDMHYEKRSTIFTINVNFKAWDEVFREPKLANAILDRILHHVSVFNNMGES